MTRTRALSNDHMLDGLPAGADPFAYISHLTTRRFTPRLPQSAIILLLIFLAFYVMIAVFNLVSLTWPYIGKSKRTLWTFKKLYIYTHSGEQLYSTPLYLINTGLLMSLSQLMSSIAAQAYIWMQIRMHFSEQYSLRCPFFAALGFLFISDTYTYWGMAHCFVSLYYSDKNFARKSKTLSWLYSPLLINIFFLLFPISITAATAAVLTRMTMTYHELQIRTIVLRATLSHGSLIWRQLELPGHSEDEKERLASQLIQAQAQLKSLLEKTGTIIPKLFDQFNSFRSMMLFFVPATSLVFALSFWKLAERYRLKGNLPSDPTIKSEFSGSWQTSSAGRHSRTSITMIQALRSDPQFLRLTIRAFSTFLGILIALSFWILAIFKPSELMMDPYWHGVASWLPTLPGSWTAIPVAWQSWRLYLDQKPVKFNRACQLEEIQSPTEPSPTARSEFVQ